MSKKWLAVVVLLLVGTLSLPAATRVVRGEFAAPASAELEKFPLAKAPLTIQEMAMLDLRATKLEANWTGFNFNARIDRFMLENLPAGTLVLVDQNEVVRYKADCGNRLVDLAKCPECGSVPVTEPVPVASPDPHPGLWQRMTEGIRDAAIAVWSGLGAFLAPFGWLALLLLGLLLLPLIGYLLYQLFRGWSDGRGGGVAPRAPEPDRPEPNPGAVVPPAPAVAVPVAQPPVEHQPAVVAPGPQPEQAPPAADQNEAPERRFINFAPGEEGGQPNMIRFAGYREVRFEQEGGTTTLRFS